MRPPSIVVVVLLVLGVVGRSWVCLALAAAVAAADVAAGAVVSWRALAGAGEHRAAIAAALLEGRLPPWPVRLVLRRIAAGG